MLWQEHLQRLINDATPEVKTQLERIASDKAKAEKEINRIASAYRRVLKGVELKDWNYHPFVAGLVPPMFGGVEAGAYKPIPLNRWRAEDFKMVNAKDFLDGTKMFLNLNTVQNLTIASIKGIRFYQSKNFAIAVVNILDTEARIWVDIPVYEGKISDGYENVL